MDSPAYSAEFHAAVRGNASHRTEIRDILAAAFAEDPIMLWLLAKAKNSLAARRLLFERGVRTTARHGVAEMTGGGEAAAMWAPPGFVKTEGVRGILDETLGLWSSWRALRGGLAQAGRFYQEMLRGRPGVPHWYLAALGTRPEARRRGAASAPLAKQLGECDAQGLPAYLESSNAANLPLYQRHGFEVLQRVSFEGSPPIWLMLRPAR